LHLQEQVGEGNPIAVAIDGYPIYSKDELNKTKTSSLDVSHGHSHSHDHKTLRTDGEDPTYHYHGSDSYPYINGSFHGEVDLEHRPNGKPIRPPGEPLRTKIISFKKLGTNRYQLEYIVRGKKNTVTYEYDDDSVTMTWNTNDGTTTTEYSRKDDRRGNGGRKQPPRGNKPPKGGKPPR